MAPVPTSAEVLREPGKGSPEVVGTETPNPEEAQQLFEVLEGLFRSC